MTWTDPAVILMAVMLMWTIGFSIWNVRNRDFGKHATALADHEARLSRVEGFVERLPQQVASHSDVELVHGRVGEVKDTLAKMRADMGEIKGTLDGLRGTVAALTSHHMERP